MQDLLLILFLFDKTFIYLIYHFKLSIQLEETSIVVNHCIPVVFLPPFFVYIYKKNVRKLH